MKIPIVTIVGRPNTGKSTLFNRIAGHRIAITASEAGTTRDRLFHLVETNEMDFFLVDTGGLQFGKSSSSIESDMKRQAEVAIDEADAILFVVEGKGELTAKDIEVTKLLRKIIAKKPILLVANKCDQPTIGTKLAHLFRLGLGEPTPVSALNKIGTDELLKRIIQTLTERSFPAKNSPIYKQALKQEKANLNIAVAGKPNVGKSSLINALLKKDKLIVSDIPGTTRDTTDSLIKHEGKIYNFIDTAGLRKRGKIEKGIEHFSSLRSMAAIEHCDIALLVLDSSEPVSHQDQQIANYILDSNKGFIILANKWDIKEDDVQEEKRRNGFIQKLQSRFPFAPWAPVIFTSAVTKKNLNHIFEQIEIIKAERSKRIQTHQLNTFVQQLTDRHKPTGTKSIRPKIFYITQAGANPPEFIIFVNKKKYFHFSYWRHLENRLREKFGFTGTAIKFEYREKEKRY